MRGSPCFVVPWADLSALLVVTPKHTQSLRTILLRFRGALDTCHPHCSSQNICSWTPGVAALPLGLSAHEPLEGGFDSSRLVRGPCVSLSFEREPGEAAWEMYVSLFQAAILLGSVCQTLVWDRGGSRRSTGARVCSPLTRKLWGLRVQGRPAVLLAFQPSSSAVDLYLLQTNLATGSLCPPYFCGIVTTDGEAGTEESSWST